MMFGIITTVLKNLLNIKLPLVYQQMSVTNTLFSMFEYM